MITVEVKGGAVTIQVPPGIKDGKYVFSDNIKENNSDVYKYYYAIPVAFLLEYTSSIGQTIGDVPVTKEDIDAYLQRKFMKTFDDEVYTDKKYEQFKPIKTKRDLTREELIRYVNMCSSFVGGWTKNVLPLFEGK